MMTVTDNPKEYEQFCQFVGNKGNRTRATRNWKVQIPEVVTIISPIEEDYKKAKERVEELCQNAKDLEALSEVVKERALYTLELLKENNVLPSLINATGDESLLFEFFINESSYSLDFYNSGEIVWLRRIKEQIPEVDEIKFEQLKEVVSEIALAYDRAIL